MTSSTASPPPGAERPGGLFHRLAAHITGDILAPSHSSFGELLRLLTPFGTPDAVRRHVATAIRARTQLLSLVFAILVPLWAVMDLLVFDLATGLWLTLLRLAAALVFLALLWPRPVSCRHPYLQAAASLTIMLLVPPVFYLASQFLIDMNSPTITQAQRLVLQIYALMPTLALAGLAVFPLSALEVLLIAVPILVLSLCGVLISGVPESVLLYGPTLWFMAMMIGVAAFSGMSQLHYMGTLVRAATRDPLTGAQNRRSGAESLERAWNRAQAEDRALAVAFIDLDRFKQINDQYGHEQGDEALRALSRNLHETLRRGDTLVRWGGEEFLAILPDAPTEELPRIVQRLTAKGFGLRPDGSPITASIGMADLRSDPVGHWATLVERADERMYQAKAAGRARAILPGGQVILL